MDSTIAGLSSMTVVLGQSDGDSPTSTLPKVAFVVGSTSSTASSSRIQHKTVDEPAHSSLSNDTNALEARYNEDRLDVETADEFLEKLLWFSEPEGSPHELHMGSMLFVDPWIIEGEDELGSLDLVGDIEIIGLPLAVENPMASSSPELLYPPQVTITLPPTPHIRPIPLGEE